MKRHRIINKLTAAVLVFAILAASVVPQSVFAQETFYSCYSRTPDPDLLGATEYFICYREFRAYEDPAVFKVVHSIVARATDHAWFSAPVISGCDYCKGRYRDTDLYSARIWAENQDGTIVAENNGLSITNCNTTGTKARYVLELTIHPKEKCEHCGNRIGSFMYINDFYFHEQVITYKSQPKDTAATEGGSASFDVQADYHDTFYRWQKLTDGKWTTLKEGAGADGEEYSGTQTAALAINNVRSNLDGAKYRCMLMGANGNYVYTNEAKLSVVSAPVTTTPTQAPTPDPVTTPAPTPVVTPIIPGGGSGQGTYTPASSSSQYTSPTPVPTQSGGATVTSSTSKNTSDNTPTYNGTITPVPAGTGGQSTAVTPAGTSSSASDKKVTGQKGQRGQKSSSSTSSSSARDVSSSASSGGHTIMKNGVLYIIDAEDGKINSGENPSSSAVEESVDADTAYSAGDLAVDATLTEKTREPGFFETGPGIATIVASALLILLLLLFFLFFGVIVFGEVEEHDEVFELCGIRLLRRKDDNWCVNLGEVFEDNAVVKLRLGILFTVIFDGADLICMTKGMYEGTVTETIQQNMELCRRNVRRSV